MFDHTLVRNHFIRSLVMTWCFCLLCWIQWYFFEVFYDNYGDLYANTLRCVKQKSKQTKIYRPMTHRICLRFHRKTDFSRFLKGSLRFSFCCSSSLRHISSFSILFLYFLTTIDICFVLSGLISTVRSFGIIFFIFTPVDLCFRLIGTPQ